MRKAVLCHCGHWNRHYIPFRTFRCRGCKQLVTTGPDREIAAPSLPARKPRVPPFIIVLFSLAFVASCWWLIAQMFGKRVLY